MVMTKTGKLAVVMALSEGDEIVVDARVWFRVDANEFKVHREGTEPDSKKSRTEWVRRTKDDVLAAL